MDFSLWVRNTPARYYCGSQLNCVLPQKSVLNYNCVWLAEQRRFYNVCTGEYWPWGICTQWIRLNLWCLSYFSFTNILIQVNSLSLIPSLPNSSKWHLWRVVHIEWQERELFIFYILKLWDLLPFHHSLALLSNRKSNVAPVRPLLKISFCEENSSESFFRKLCKSHCIVLVFPNQAVPLPINLTIGSP